MDIQEKAEKYAEGKIHEALNNAVVEAYREGYKDGYKDREEEIPVDLRDNKTEYVDLGLPSGTLWSKDYERKDDKRLYVPYGKAITHTIPTEEQWKELMDNCKFKFIKQSNSYNVKCVGPNGNDIIFNSSFVDIEFNSHCDFMCGFWIRSTSYVSENYKGMAILENIVQNDNNNLSVKTDGHFTGYKLPIRLVR